MDWDFLSLSFTHIHTLLCAELNDNKQVYAPIVYVWYIIWWQEPMHFALPSHKYYVVIICGIFAFSVIASSNMPYPYHMDGSKAHYEFYVGDDMGGRYVYYDLLTAPFRTHTYT